MNTLGKAHSNRDLAELSRQARRLVIDAIHTVGTGHAGSSLSIIEVLTYLYFNHLNIDPANPDWPERDRLVFSKGHGCPALYAVLSLRGYFAPDLMRTLRRFGSPLQGHPHAGMLAGVDQSTGSLGQGISCGLGTAIGLRMARSTARVFCILGDGEMQEGQNWEAFMAAAHYRTGNLIAIVDSNRLQSDGRVAEIMALDDIADKMRAFGWSVSEIDGHDFDAIAKGVGAASGDRPHFVVANTIKGRGVSYMEDVMHWHHHPIADDEFADAMEQLGVPS